MIMRMKYFRFLHWETGACLTHFGELEDTAEGKKFSFLYLRGTGKLVNQTEAEHTLFLCPNYVDLAVLGQADRQTEEELRRVLRHTKIGTLVLPAEAGGKRAECPGRENPEQAKSDNLEQPEMELLKRMGSEYTDEGKQEIFEKPNGVERLVYLGEGEKLRPDGTEGWTILVTCWTKGALAMVHGVNREDQEQSLFDDCVMNVKRLDCSRRCGKTKEPDGYGCALGCVLHQDFDVCKYRREGQDVMSLTGTVLTAGKGNNEEWEALEKTLYEEGIRIRFFALQDAAGCGWWRLLRNRRDRSEPKRYYIGSEAEMSDRMIAMLCKDGFNQIPVALREDEGICCSGLVRYREQTVEMPEIKGRDAAESDGGYAA